jgi:hypothetical protein
MKHFASYAIALAIGAALPSISYAQSNPVQPPLPVYHRLAHDDTVTPIAPVPSTSAAAERGVAAGLGHRLAHDDTTTVIPQV